MAAGLADASGVGIEQEPKRWITTGRTQMGVVDVGRKDHCGALAAERNHSRTDHLPLPSGPQRPHKLFL